MTIEKKITELEANQNRQELIDMSYNEFLSILVAEMNTHLNPRDVTRSNANGKRGRVSKLWWNNELTSEWSGLPIRENMWLKCKNKAQSQRLKAAYVQKWKQFDKSVQRRKRNYWYNKNCLRHVTTQTDTIFGKK